MLFYTPTYFRLLSYKCVNIYTDVTDVTGVGVCMSAPTIACISLQKSGIYVLDPFHTAISELNKAFKSRKMNNWFL